MAPQRGKLPISIVAVSHIDHIDRLPSEFDIYAQNVQFEDVGIFTYTSDEEKYLLFQHGEIDGK